MSSVERYRGYAENARKRAQAASDKAHSTFDRIEPGQPIITGRGSRTTADINRRERAWANIGKATAEQEKAADWDRRADKRERYEERLEDAVEVGEKYEGVKVGDTVTAHFTNCGHFHRFKGEIVGRTVNDWKVRCLENFRSWNGEQTEEIGRTFKIAAFGSRTYSVNNRVYKLEDA